MKTLRKYKNRKLYDPATGRYTTLKELGLLFVNKTPVRVICKSTQLDITNQCKLEAAYTLSRDHLHRTGELKSFVEDVL